jgi:hypothetical protein
MPEEMSSGVAGGRTTTRGGDVDDMGTASLGGRRMIRSR